MCGLINNRVDISVINTLCFKKTGPLQVISHNFVNSQHLLITFGTSDTGIGNELIVVSRGFAGQGPVDESCNLEHDTPPHRKPVQLPEHRRDMIASAGARQEPGGSVLN